MSSVKRRVLTGKNLTISDVGIFFRYKSCLLRKRICENEHESKHYVSVDETYDEGLLEPLRMTYGIPYCHSVLHLVLESDNEISNALGM